MLTFLKANMERLPTPLDPAIRRSHQELFQAEMTMGMNWIHSFQSLDSDLPRKVIWHNGGTGGFSTYLGFTEDRQFGVFVLSNTAVGVDALAKEILKALVREYEPRQPQGGRGAWLRRQSRPLESYLACSVSR
jgi:serine-type D-Ala-D-Ala carboxypeptidase/endopeptidase